jgi:hypothetical protein
MEYFAGLDVTIMAVIIKALMLLALRGSGSVLGSDKI